MLIFLHIYTRACAPMNTHVLTHKGQVERSNKAAMTDTSVKIRLTLQRRRETSGGETVETQEEERERKTAVIKKET